MSISIESVWSRSSASRRIRLGEGRANGVEKHLAREVDHAQPPPVLHHHGVAAARAALRIVGRSHDPLLTVEEAVDLPVAVGVVAERDRVDAGLEQLTRRLLGDPDSSGRVLAVGDHEVGLVLVAQSGSRADSVRLPRPPTTSPMKRSFTRCDSANLRPVEAGTRTAATIAAHDLVKRYGSVWRCAACP